VHRDVKPNNILAYREGHRLQVKLGDFGLAKCHEDAGLSAMTDDGSVRGTLAYMSPEQIQDSRSVGPQSDLFSVGACLYRLLTGLHPRLTAQGVRCDPATLKAANLPSPLIRLIEASMQPDTNQRPKSAAVMQQQLQPYHGK
jgi:serine/threonine protein kinase